MAAKSTATSKTRKTHRVGLYIRVSTEEQAENPEGSIKSQEQRLRSHLDLLNQEAGFGEVSGVFVDKAKSGKDVNRPELQRLLQAIRRGEITLVMVTELSRLSRSIKDICEIWELMRAQGCEFLSLRERFDTTTAAGEMVLYTIANIAQFERKQCSERIQANFLARAQRGLFNGGSVPFGYELDPEKRGYLRIEKTDASTVGEAFRTFLREGSLSSAGKSLNDRGYRLSNRRQGGGNKARLGFFTVGNLHQMLTNPVYVARRSFEVKGEAKSTRACWDPIIDERTFQEVQAMLKANHRRNKRSMNRRYPFLLSGLVVCGTCGDRLPGKSAHGNAGKIPYYEHGWATKRQAYLNKRIFSCDPHRVLAKRLEPVVWEDLLRVLNDQSLVRSLIEQARQMHESQAHVSDSDRIRTKIRDVETQIEALAEHLTKIPKGVSPAPIFAQMEKLEGLKAEQQRDLEALARSGAAIDLPATFRDYTGFLRLVREVLATTDSTELRTRVVQSLVHKVEVLPGSAKIHYALSGGRFIPLKDSNQGKQPGVHTPGSGPFQARENPALAAHKSVPWFLLGVGSNSLTNGRGSRI